MLSNLRILISFAFTVFFLSVLLGERYVVEGILIEPPNAYVNADGNLVLIDRVITVPEATVMTDGSLLLDGVIHPVPELPGEGYSSFNDCIPPGPPAF